MLEPGTLFEVDISSCVEGGGRGGGVIGTNSLMDRVWILITAAVWHSSSAVTRLAAHVTRVTCRVSWRQRWRECVCWSDLPSYRMTSQPVVLRRTVRGRWYGGLLITIICRSVFSAARGATERWWRQTRLAHALLLLHASVLEPDFHLSFVEAESCGNLDATRTSQVFVEVELLLKLRQLFVCEVRSTHVRLARCERVVLARFHYNKKKKIVCKNYSCKNGL